MITLAQILGIAAAWTTLITVSRYIWAEGYLARKVNELTYYYGAQLEILDMAEKELDDSRMFWAMLSVALWGGAIYEAGWL